MINTRVNNIRHVHEEKEFIGIEEKDGIDLNTLKTTVEELINSGISRIMIKEEILPHLGFKTSSLPDEVKILLK
jgi:hypothetical protein